MILAWSRKFGGGSSMGLVVLKLIHNLAEQ